MQEDARTNRRQVPPGVQDALMMKMNKKGMFMFVLFIVGLFALSAAYIYFTMREKDNPEQKVIGVKQLALIQKYNQEDLLLLNIDQASKMSAAKALKDLYKIDIEGCAKSEEYIIINECDASDAIIENKFKQLFRRSFQEYLEMVTDQVKEYDYNITVDKEYIYGISNKSINETREHEEIMGYTVPEFSISYFVKPDFKQKVEGPSEVISLVNEAKQDQACLKDYNELVDDPTKCFPDSRYIWRINKKDDIVFLDVTLKEKKRFVGNIDSRLAINLNR